MHDIIYIRIPFVLGPPEHPVCSLKLFIAISISCLPIQFTDSSLSGQRYRQFWWACTVSRIQYDVSIVVYARFQSLLPLYYLCCHRVRKYFNNENFSIYGTSILSRVFSVKYMSLILHVLLANVQMI